MDTTTRLLAGAAGSGGGLLDNMAPDIGTGSDTPLFIRDSNSSTYQLSISFNSTGTIAVACGNSKFKKFSLSTAWDLSTATETQSVNKWLDYSPQNATWLGNIYSVVFKSDGTKCWIATAAYDPNYNGGNWKYGITEVLLSTAWDLSTWSLNHTVYQANFSQIYASMNGIAVAEDGSKLYFTQGTTLHELSLPTAFDLSSAVYSTSTGFANTVNTLGGIAWSSNGNKLYVVDQGYKSTAAIYEYPVNTPWAVSTTNTSGVTAYPVNQYQNIYNLNEFPNSVTVAGNGLKIYYTTNGSGSYSEVVGSISLSTANDISSASVSHPSNCIFYETQRYWIGDQVWRSPMLFNDTGTQIMLVGRDQVTSRKVFFLFNLNTAWDLSSWNSAAPTIYDSINITSDIGYINYDFAILGMCWSHDGTKLIISTPYYGSNPRIATVDVSTPYDITTQQSNTFTAASTFNDGTGPTTTTQIAINGDGTKIWLDYYGTVHEYSLTTAYDYSTMTHQGTVSGIFTYPWCFNSDGTQLLINNYSEYINSYDLPAPYDLMNATIDRFNPSSQSPDPLWETMGTPRSMHLSTDESKLFISSNIGGLGIATFNL